MILILSDENDLHADIVMKILENANVNFVRMNLGKEALLRTFITFKNYDWYVDTSKYKFKSSQIKAVWNRRTYVELLLDEYNDGNSDFKIWKSEWNKTLLGLYNSLTNAVWLNNYRNSQRAENKYLQMEIAKEIGFLMPDIIVSNQKNELLDFAKKHKFVALKLMHQDFYKSIDGQYQGLYVNRITENSLLKFKDSGENSIVLQKYIEKSYEVRYTVVNDEHFVCRIDSQSSEKAKFDWRRYDIANTPHSIIEPPKEIFLKVQKLMQTLNLFYGALDFIVDKNEQWYFLEINSMGQYLWIEDLTGLQISNAISNFLIFNSK